MLWHFAYLRDIRLSIDEGSDKDACIHADAYWQCEAITNIVKNSSGARRE